MTGVVMLRPARPVGWLSWRFWLRSWSSAQLWGGTVFG
jgi:hypothetical protein